MRKELTEKQENFCHYYLDCDGNASEAYRMAYDASNMKPESIWTNACKLVKTAKVAQRIDELRDERRKTTEVKRETVEKVLMDIVTADINELYIADARTGKIKLRTPSQLPKRARNAMKKMTNKRGEVTYEFNGKTEAAKLLASMNGWNAPQQVSVTGKDGVAMKELRIGFDDEE